MKAKFKRNSAAQDAAINAGIASDPDAPEWTDDVFAAAQPAAQALPEVAYAALVERRRRGAQRAPVKELISVRLDRDLVEQLRASGPGWQARMNETLRKAVMK